QITDNDIIEWINDAQRKIAGRNDSILEKTATASSVSGQQEYSFPTDMHRFKSMSYKGSAQVSYQTITGLTLLDFNMYIDGWDQNTSAPGVPAAYCIHANKFLVYPIPQESITNAFKVYYCRNPVDVAIDSDIIDLPADYHDVVVNLVLQDAYEMDEDWQAASAKSSQTNLDLDRLKSSDE